MEGRIISFEELLLSELKLEPCQWEESAVGAGAAPPELAGRWREADCLVHREWLSNAKSGQLSRPLVPSICQEEIHRLLQPSTGSVVPRPWQRVHLVCVRRTEDPGGGRTTGRLLVPQFRSYSTDSIHGFLTQVSQENQLVSWREILQLLQKEPEKPSSRRPVTSTFVRLLLKHLYQVDVHTVGRGDDEGDEEGTEEERDVRVNSKVSFEKLSDVNLRVKELMEVGTHGNLSPVLAAMESPHAFYLVFPYLRFTLFDVAIHSSAMVDADNSTSKPLFLMFQLLKLLDHCHSHGVTLGELSLKDVFVNAQLWVQVRLPPRLLCDPWPKGEGKKNRRRRRRRSRRLKGKQEGGEGLPARHGLLVTSSRGVQRELTLTPTPADHDTIEDGSDTGILITPSATGDSCPSSPTKKQTGFFLHSALAGSTSTLTDASLTRRRCNSFSCSVSQLAASYVPPSLRISDAVEKWCHGELSNFDYLMVLNHHAGRRLGEPNNHPIFPWVMDFTHRNSNLRDLSSSKHRLSKGDRQLNFTYASAQEEIRRGNPDQEPMIPHHIGDISSDVTYYVYMARRTPKEVLCSCVRPRWVPEEYPSSMEKMYIWSPDECIPEFFADASIFQSIHPDLPDLAVPSWCSSPDEFVAMHRSTLESDLVSSQLHHWIDLVFGHKLSGEAAVRAKNVYLSLVDKHTNPSNFGIVQLFRSQHPKRMLSSSAPLPLYEWQSSLNMSSVMNATVFSIGQGATPPNNLPPQEPESGNARTIESIISQQARKDSIGDSDVHNHSTLGDDSSFEHVGIPDDLNGRGTPSLPNGIDYGPPSFNVSHSFHGKEHVHVPTQQQQQLVSMSTMAAQTKGFRVVDYLPLFRQRRSNQGESQVADSQYEWEKRGISIPKESNLCLRLSQLEELGHFSAKACGGCGELFKEQWRVEDMEVLRPVHKKSRGVSHAHSVLKALKQQHKDPTFNPCFEDRVAIDVTAVVCMIVELCCMKQLRSALPVRASLLERVSAIRRLLKSGELHLPSYLINLADVVFSPKSDRNSYREDLFVPSLSPNLLLQPFISIIAFPRYFDPLYTFVHRLELLSRETPLAARDITELTVQQQELLLQRAATSSSDPSSSSLNRLIGYVSENLDPLLNTVGSQGFPLLFLHIFPFFQHMETFFDAIHSFLDPLAAYMSCRAVGRLFTTPVLRLFDSPIEPYQRGHLLSRTMADVLLRRFGLRLFLSRFIGFIVEAMIEPARVASRGSSRKPSYLFRLKSASALTLVQSDIFQSNRFEDVRNTSDLTYSYTLTEAMRGYDSDEKEWSSGDSDESDYPETSLLAKSSMFMGPSHETDVLPPLPEQDEEQPESPAVGRKADDNAPPHLHRIGSVPQNSSGDSVSSPVSTVPPSGSATWPRLDDSAGALSSQMGHERLHVSSNVSSLGIDTTSTEYNASVGSPSLMTQSVTLSLSSEASHDASGTFPGVASPCATLTRQASLALGRPIELSIDGIFGEAGENSGDDEAADNESLLSTDPEVIAINRQISEVAADCICWLIRRLGPFLTTRHITRPLLDNLNRCFSGILHRKGQEVVVVGCLRSIAEYYGEMVITKLYIPYAETLVLHGTNRMTVKSEAGVAASLAIVRMSLDFVSMETLEMITMGVCDNYFVPMIQLLSSETTFPSGGHARAAICHSVVLILKEVGKRLGREKASVLLTGTLQCFFTCFDAVHTRPHLPHGLVNGYTDAEESETAGRGTGDAPARTTNGTIEDHLDGPSTLVASGKVVSKATDVNSHPLSSSPYHDRESIKREEDVQRSSSLIEETEAYKQLCTTFSPAMAHAAYIPFCILLGQIKLNTILFNTELIERIAYDYDKVASSNSPLPTVLDMPYASVKAENQTHHPSTKVEVPSDSESDYNTDEDFEDDPAIKLGPAAVFHSNSGLGMDSAGFSTSSWFVGLKETEDVRAVDGGGGGGGEGVKGEEVGVASGKGGGVSSGLPRYWQNRSSSTEEQLSELLRRNSAKFEARFSPVQTAESPEGKRRPAPVASPEDTDCVLQGNWAALWESQLHTGLHMQEPYSFFKGLKLQSFHGHRGPVKSLFVGTSENVFFSGSKDKTVKIWSLRNHGDGSAHSAASYTYTGHQKTVFSVELLRTTNNAVSCDGTVHLWDPETGYCVHQFSSPRGSQFTVMKALPAPHPAVAVGTADLMLRLIDARAKSYQHLWKLQFPTTGGTLRCLACSDNWIAVGHNSGIVNTLDIRTGELLKNFAATGWGESLFQLKPTRRGNLISSVGGGVFSLYRPASAKLLHQIRGHNSTPHCLDFIDEQLVSVSSNGVVTVHSSFELYRDPPATSIKIRTKELKPSIVAMSALPENRLLLLGNDSGQIALMA